MNDTKDEKRGWLIKLAIEIMGRQGIRKTTLDDIAAVAGMATPSLYYYFRNKNEVIRAAISTVLQSLLNDIKLAVASQDTAEHQLSASAHSLARVRQLPFIISIDNRAKSDVTVIACDLIDEFNANYSKIIKDIIQRGNQNGSFSVENCEAAAKIISNCMWGLLMNNVGKPEFDILRGELEELSSMFIYGLKRQ